ncbi:unnamed protein product [Trichogramma brassicae]|uniref:Uncharacterized protein n=1 Tax=Trichogramma brassicae TaxID=86971 RepID=A0A6H5I7L8_9HYME|nr:unnamed protein product [Trichogramma brassicae]
MSSLSRVEYTIPTTQGREIFLSIKTQQQLKLYERRFGPVRPSSHPRIDMHCSGARPDWFAVFIQVRFVLVADTAGGVGRRSGQVGQDAAVLGSEQGQTQQGTGRRAAAYRRLRYRGRYRGLDARCSGNDDQADRTARHLFQLQSWRVPIDARDKRGRTPLHLA